MSSCCAGKCSCGPSCSCASDCNGCGMAPDLSHMEGSTTETLVMEVAPQKSRGMAPDQSHMEEGSNTETLVMEVAPQKSHLEASEMGVAAKNRCKCGDNCLCNPCNCK